ncbi:MAG TPA: hypothetical protein VFB54_03935 [Burkholderiales bacterium]|nr:hypothetical protein [Burkholderiales bacterium]
MAPHVRSVLIASGGLALILAVGFYLQLDWVTGMWPWPTSRLSNIFIASILAASGVPVLWIALSGEAAAITAGAIDFGLMYSGMTAFSLQVYADSGREAILIYAAMCAALAVFCIATALRTRQVPFRDNRPLPMGVWASFVVFVLLLTVIGTVLLLHKANVFPWPLDPQQSVLYGWIFLGAACYFLYALLKPVWSNAQGQLLGFLAYDLVLIVPFVGHFPTVRADLRMNLIVYTSVLIYSGLLATYYLFINRATRFGRVLQSQT